jgi:phage tail sheath protein FI
MSNYIKGTNFTVKDTLPTGNASKIIRGAEIDDELTAIASAVSSKADSDNGTFTVVIRQGNDNQQNKTVLETWTNVSLDPNAANYISAVIGDKKQTVQYDPSTGHYYINSTGDYNNNSRYVRVKEVLTPTYNYLGNGNTPSAAYLTYLPLSGSGSIGGAFNNATGNDLLTAKNFYNNIDINSTQGITNPATSYAKAVDLMGNTDEYDYQLIATPGLVNQIASHTPVISNVIANTEEVGDAFYIMDLVGYNANLGTVTQQAALRNTSYAASYWPWVQVLSPATGKLVWVPASVVMPGVYAFNDRVAAEWFAPAGLNRGGLGGALQAERKLNTTERDILYVGKVNPIASFPGVGLVAYGQKTLQTQASALDRINVRRLLINLKRYVGEVASTLLFEQNTITTRNNFLAQVNPYLEQVQQKQGLYAYKVVMDDSNNTPAVIDRNQLVGAIYIQPTKTVEYIYLTFNITPTGVSFE